MLEIRALLTLISTTTSRLGTVSKLGKEAARVTP
jgi:hypothetical protein